LTEELVARRRISPSDLNPANRLFGGRLLAWIDEHAATYAMYQLRTLSIVTAKVSEVDFIRPVVQGDFLEFYVSTVKLGKTTITVHVRVANNRFGGVNKTVANCELVFVCIDVNGKPTPHFKEDKKI